MKINPQRRGAEYAQDTGNEMVTCDKYLICRPVPETDAVFGPARWAGGSFGLPHRRVALPTGSGCGARMKSIVPAWPRFAGSSNLLLETAGYDQAFLRDRRASAGGGADIGIRTEDSGQIIPESQGEFVPQDAGGELLMTHECPVIRAGAGNRKDGVKAVEDDRSPSPRGTTEGHGDNGRRRRLRCRASEAIGGAVGMHDIPESRF